MTPTAAPDERDTVFQRPAAEERPPAPIATILLVFLVLAATGAIAYFAFSGRAADTRDDAIRYEAPAAGGVNNAPAPVQRP